MSLKTAKKEDIIDKLDELSPENLAELQAFIEFLRFKSDKHIVATVEQSGKGGWQSALQATFGMWADRDDVDDDGVSYVQNIRQGHRLNDLLRPTDGRCFGDSAL